MCLLPRAWVDAVKVRFVVQPYADGEDLRDFLEAVAADSTLDTMRIVVAWTKRSGLARVANDIKAIRDRGGRILAVVGVSEGGATQQGLQGLIDAVDEAGVFHDAGRTFHPKVYLATGVSHALLLVGSHNLTAGGVAWNYEAGLWCELDLSLAADKQVVDDVIAYFNRLRADTGVFKPLDSATLTAILADTTLLIQDEDTARRRRSTTDADAPEDSDSSEPGTTAQPPAPVFGRSAESKRKAPATPSRTPAKAPRRAPASIAGAVAGSRSAIAVQKRWFKELDGTAAQQPPSPNTNPTGNLRLSQESFSIDHTTYFRAVFLGGVNWTPHAGTTGMEEVWLSWDVVIAGDHLGAVDLRVSHYPKRIQGQGNVPTVLHWGNLSARMRANNYVGLTVTLERGARSRFHLTIADAATGAFKY